MENKALFTHDEIKIDAPIHKVWRTLTEPEQTRQYMYNCDVESTWKPGDTRNMARRA